MYETNFSRSEQHTEFLAALAAKGYLPSDWTRLVARGIDKSEAKATEEEAIKRMLPRFNKNHNSDYSAHKATETHGEELLETVLALHLEGLGYQRIAYLCGAEVPKNKIMSIKRILLHAKAIQ
jgi:hypothetical protein